MPPPWYPKQFFNGLLSETKQVRAASYLSSPSGPLASLPDFPSPN